MQRLCGQFGWQEQSPSGRHSRALVLLHRDCPPSRSIFPALLGSYSWSIISHVPGAQVPERIKPHSLCLLGVCLKSHKRMRGAAREHDNLPGVRARSTSPECSAEPSSAEFLTEKMDSGH